MNGELGKKVLKGVSRSFYLTLRLLPQAMRPGASLGYLLARTSDTLADTAAIPEELRLTCLDRFRNAVARQEILPPWPEAVRLAVADPRERLLLERGAGVLALMDELPESQAALVREVVDTIIGGQISDLVCFAGTTKENPKALPDDAALEHYTWSVAGCVGAFWTKLGIATLEEAFVGTSHDEWIERGIAYGKGLQLVNILRDLPEDLAMGRCYLPVADPKDQEVLLACHAKWLSTGSRWVGEGLVYSRNLRSRRLRAATVLPALIARQTLQQLEGAGWESLRRKIKIPRRMVYRSLLQAFCPF